MSTLKETSQPLPHEVPGFDYFLAEGFESLNAFHDRYPIQPGYPVRCTEGCGILLRIDPIPGTKPVQHVAGIDLGNDKGWRTNMGFVRHAAWGKESAKQKGHQWPEIAQLSPTALELLGAPGAPLRDSYERLLAEQALATC